MGQLLLPNCTWAAELGEGTGTSTIVRRTGDSFSFAGANSPTWIDTPVGKGIQFSSSGNSYLSTASSRTVNQAATPFVELFVMFDAYAASNQYSIATFRLSTGSSGIAPAAYNGTGWNYFWGGYLNNFRRMGANFVPTTGKWYHLVHPILSQDTYTKCCINGVITNSVDTSSGGAIAQTNKIGGLGDSTLYDHRGKIGYIRVYEGTQLTDKIAQLLYQRHIRSNSGLL